MKAKDDAIPVSYDERDTIPVWSFSDVLSLSHKTLKKLFLLACLLYVTIYDSKYVCCAHYTYSYVRYRLSNAHHDNIILCCTVVMHACDETHAPP
jgi:hypothetical protein